MRHAPRPSTLSLARPAAALLVLAMSSAAVSGCLWFRSDNAFAAPEASRPLEVPPDLDLPDTEGAMAPPAGTTASVTRSSMSPAAATSGFTTSGDRLLANSASASWAISGVSKRWACR